MELIHKMQQAIASKIDTSFSNLEQNLEDSMANNCDFKKIFDQSKEIVYNKTTVHFDNILNYFTVELSPSKFSKQLTKSIQQRQEETFQSLQIVVDDLKMIQIDYDYRRDPRKEMIARQQIKDDNLVLDNIEATSQPVCQDNEPIASNLTNQCLQSIQLIQQFPRDNQVTNIAIINEINYPQTIQQNCIQNKMKQHQEVVSNPNPESLFEPIIQTKDIVQQLKRRKEKLMQRQKKSVLLRQSIIRLQPIYTNLDRKIKTKLAEQKINENINFIQNIKRSQRQTKFIPTLWKQDNLSIKRFDGLSAAASTIRQSNFLKLSQLGYAYQTRDKHDFHSPIKSVNLPRIDNRRSLPKILPYSIYSINQKKEQTFRLNCI